MSHGLDINPELEFSRLFDMRRLDGGTTRLSLSATAGECARLAERFGWISLDRLEADLNLRITKSGDAVRVRGTLAAELQQPCVVTLEPLAESVSAEIDVMFAEVLDDDEPDLDYDAEHDDPPEPINEGMMELGEALAQILAVEVNPYPRAPGAPGTDHSTDGSVTASDSPDPSEHPFAALAQLKKDPENKA